MRGYRWVGPVILLATAGCFRLPSGPTTAPGPEPTTAATDDEARAVAAELEAAVRSGDRSRAMQEFALEVVAHRVVTGLPLTAGTQADLLKILPARADTNELVDNLLILVARGCGLPPAPRRPGRRPAPGHLPAHPD